MPDQGEIEEFRQPIVRVNFVLPTEYIGPIMKLCTDRRGEYVRTEYLSPTRAMLTYDLPLADVIYDMHDKLKSATRGYGTMDYELLGYRPGDLVRLDILVKGDRDRRALDHLRPPRRRRPRPGRRQEAQQEIPRHMFEVPLQAAIGSRIIARETISAMRKNVTAKCYGGDITPQAQALGEAEGRQEADEVDRPGRHPAEGVPGRAGNGRRRRQEEVAFCIKPRPLVAVSFPRARPRTSPQALQPARPDRPARNLVGVNRSAIS